MAEVGLVESAGYALVAAKKVMSLYRINYCWQRQQIWDNTLGRYIRTARLLIDQLSLHGFNLLVLVSPATGCIS